MCEIFGLISIDGRFDKDIIAKLDTNYFFKYSDKDDNGYFSDEQIFFGYRYLDNSDLSSLKHPVFNEDRSKCIILNGTIFNYKDIRAELIKLGHFFQINNDEEVIVHAYEQWGAECVHKLNGMFSFVIWDNRRKKLFAVRDRLGVKPLFYAEYHGLLFFASELNTILQLKGTKNNLDNDALASYFMLSYIPEPLTIFKEIKKLLAGHTLECSNGNVSIKKYWDIYFVPDYKKNKTQMREDFIGLFEEAVKLQMASDMPVGAFLSGGIDSGLVVALMSRNNDSPLNTFCMGFGGETGGYLDERPYAQKVAERYGAAHSEYIVKPDPESIIEDIVRAFGEPFADHSTIPSYYLCRETRKKVNVALSGLGGDELFGGYERYLGFKLSSFYNKVPFFIRENIIKRLALNIPERKDGHYTVNHLKRFVRSVNLPQDTRYISFFSRMSIDKKQSLFSSESFLKNFDNGRDLVLEYFNSRNAEDPLDRAFYCDMKTYLPGDTLACSDRMSSLHSLEVRVPFIDYRLVEFCATIPNSMKINFFDKKHLLKKAAIDFLPKDVIYHRKQGFVGPMSKWLQTDLKKYALYILSEKNLKKHNLFNRSTVRTILDEHFNGVENNDFLIWSLIVFQVWFDMYL